jgi:hypothetical protein
MTEVQGWILCVEVGVLALSALLGGFWTRRQ